MAPFRSYEHLLRLAAVFAAGVALFLGARWLLVPSDYGRLGAYRASALVQNQLRPIAYAGQVACVECHTDVAELRRSNELASPCRTPRPNRHSAASLRPQILSST